MGLICSKTQLRNILMNQHNSEVIISTCGCFEIFHIGHLECIEKAKKLGDILIVGINSDQYIKINKKRKPVFNENDRCKIVASIQGVDYVFLFDDLTFDNCLRDLHPDYFVKGLDRTEVLEKKTADEFDIKIVHVGDVKRASATDLRKYFI